MDTFKILGIEEPVLKSIEDEKFERPSEIQEKIIPLSLKGKDIIAGSATGTGKTLAFGVAIIQGVEPGNGVQSLVLVPTRELAEQVATSLNNFSKYLSHKIIAVYGGVSINPQIVDLQRADIVVGTPGRILDHISRNTINLSKVKILVLDEADRMLDMGFIDDVEEIIRRCPRERQTMMLSATIQGELGRIAQKYMKDPEKVSLENFVDPRKLLQVYYDVPDNMKFSLLVHLLKNETSGLVMVFCNTQVTTEIVAKNLKKQGIDALGIHGGHSQNKRNQTMEDFHNLTAQVLVCTDVAARGLDIKDVSHVYNYDSPQDEKQYIHRIGRTARAGAEGKVINLICSKDHDNFRRILAFTYLDVPKIPTPVVERVPFQWESNSEHFRGGGFRGRGHGHQGGGRPGFRGGQHGGHGRSGHPGNRHHGSRPHSSHGSQHRSHNTTN
jgi:ATP-dependent RNA helicase DeaD